MPNDLNAIFNIIIDEFAHKAISTWLQIFLVISIVFVSIYKFGNSLFFKLYGKRVARRESHWLQSILRAVAKPLVLLAFILPLHSVAKIALAPNPSAVKIIHSTHNLLITISLSWMTLRLIRNFEAYFTEYISSLNDSDNSQIKIDKSTIDIVSKLLSLITILIATLSLLNAFGFGIETLIAFGSITGVAIGWGARDFMSSLFATVIIYLDKPFILGDKIKLMIQKNSVIEGFVERINWRFTEVRTLDEGLIIVPNLLFTSIIVENVTMTKAKRTNILLTISRDGMQFYGDYEEIDKWCDRSQAQEKGVQTRYISNYEKLLAQIENKIHSNAISEMMNPIKIEMEIVKMNESAAIIKFSVFYLDTLTTCELQESNRRLYYTIGDLCDAYKIKFEIVCEKLVAQ